jgi:hypothetical protein
MERGIRLRGDACFGTTANRLRAGLSPQALSALGLGRAAPPTLAETCRGMRNYKERAFGEGEGEVIFRIC